MTLVAFLFLLYNSGKTKATISVPGYCYGFYLARKLRIRPCSNWCRFESLMPLPEGVGFLSESEKTPCRPHGDPRSANFLIFSRGYSIGLGAATKFCGRRTLTPRRTDLTTLKVIRFDSFHQREACYIWIWGLARGSCIE